MSDSSICSQNLTEKTRFNLTARRDSPINRQINAVGVDQPPQKRDKQDQTWKMKNRQNQRSSALLMTERRLGLGSNADLLLCWCEEGRINAVKALFTHSPSTPPILTSEFFIADLRMLSRVEGYESALVLWLPTFLWRLHLKEPGWFVGEHIHVFFWAGIGRFFLVVITWFEIDRFGEIDRGSIENRKPADREFGEYRFTRVGEADRWWLLCW